MKNVTKRSFAVLTSLVMCFSLLFGLSFSAQAAEAGCYVKVTEAPADWSGTYLIVYENEEGNVAFNGGLDKLDTVSNTVSVAISDGKIAADDAANAAAFTIEAAEGGYAVKSASGYYIGQTTDANGLKSSTSPAYVNTISLNDDLSVNLVSSGAYLRYNAATNQLRFRYYKSSTYTNQKAIALYKFTDGTDGGDDNTEAKTYTVTFVENGVTISTTTAKSGDKITLPDSVGALGTDKSFIGWAKEGSSETLDAASEYTVTANTVFHAQYKIVQDNTEDAETTTATITFDDTSKRTVGTTSQQVWVENGITVTNDKGASTSNVNTNYYNPIRLYKSSSVTVEYPNMVKLEITANTSSYANVLVSSIGSNATASGSVVTVEFSSAVNSFNIASLTAQTRVDSITVYAVKKAKPSGKINGAQIEVGADLSMNYYVSLTNVADDAKIEMRFTMFEQDPVTTAVAWNPGNAVDGVYIFKFEGISPQCMTELIDAKLVLIDGESETVLDSVIDYSIKQNATNLLAVYSNDAALKQFLTDMLYYGEASQQYTNYNTESLATSGVTNIGTQLEAAPSAADKMVLTSNTESIGDIRFKSATVWFDSVNKLIIKLNSATENTELKLNGNVVMSGAGNTAYTTDEIKATAFDEIYTFELYENGTLVQTLKYSVNSYTYSKMSSSNAKTANLALALYRYGISAQAYAASLQQ